MAHASKSPPQSLLANEPRTFDSALHFPANRSDLMDDDVITILLHEMLLEWSTIPSAARRDAIEHLYRLTNGPEPNDGTMAKAEQWAIFGHLSRVIDKIADPRHWTSAAIARDEEGREVPWSAPTATQWDIYGAWHATKVRGDEVSLDTLLAPEVAHRHISVQELNDQGGHAETLAALRIARRRFMSPELALRVAALGSDL